jgi:hypothetical protein
MRDLSSMEEEMKQAQDEMEADRQRKLDWEESRRKRARTDIAVAGAKTPRTPMPAGAATVGRTPARRTFGL